MNLENKVSRYTVKRENEYKLPIKTTRIRASTYNYSDNHNPVSRFPIEKVHDAVLPRGEGWVVLGMFDTVTKRAQANYRQHPAQFAFTEIHEAVHAISDYMGRNNEEIITDMLAIRLGAPPFSRTAEEYRNAA